MTGSTTHVCGLQSWWCAPAPVRAPVAAADAMEAMSPRRASSAFASVDADEDDILLHEMVCSRLAMHIKCLGACELGCGRWRRAAKR
jgi:hypothetical protein